MSDLRQALQQYEFLWEKCGKKPFFNYHVTVIKFCVVFIDFHVVLIIVFYLALSLQVELILRQL
jgi:hypothetical protein